MGEHRTKVNCKSKYVLSLLRVDQSLVSKEIFSELGAKNVKPKVKDFLKMFVPFNITIL